jgi:hypothetical protein
MSLSKNIAKGLRGEFYLSEAQNPIPPLHSVYVYRYKVYLLSQGRGGELTREKVRGAIVHKAGRKYQHGLPISPIYKLD